MKFLLLLLFLLSNFKSKPWWPQSLIESTQLSWKAGYCYFHFIILLLLLWGKAGPDPAFPLLFHENPASPLFFFMKIPHSVEFSHRYLESRFSFPEKYIKKSFLQKIINAGCRLAPRIHILNLHVFFKVPAKKKCLFYLSMMKEHDMIIAIWVFSEDFTLSNFY